MESQLNKLLKNNRNGFSLIELMIVIAIIGLLIGLVGPKVMNSFDRAKVDTTRVNMKQITNVLKTYRLDCGQYPSTDQGLDALKAKPASGEECKNYAPGGYLQNPAKDAWDVPFLYTSDGNTFEIKSLGSDKKEGGADYAADVTITDAD